MSKVIQMSILPLAEGNRQISRGELWACPNGHGKPPYLIYPYDLGSDASPNLYGDTKWLMLFRNKKTGKVGILKAVGEGMYWFDSPRLTPAHKYDNAQEKREHFASWTEVKDSLEMVSEDQTVVFSLTGSEREAFSDVNSII